MTERDDLHPDDETLSAFVDGMASDADADHVAACVTCSARVDQLAQAARAIGMPVASPSGAAVDAAIAAALGATTRDASIVAFRRRPAWFAPVAAVAALVALALGAASVLTDSGPDRTTTAAGPRDETAGRSMAAGNQLDLGDLDEARLRPAIDALLPSELTMSAPAPAAGSGQGGGVADSSAAAEEKTEPATSAETCEAAVRDGNPALPARVGAAPGRWKGEPAVVLVFRAGPSGDIHVYVTTRQDCRILHFARFAS